MPTYRVTAPDGTVYNVTPPEGTNPSQDEIMAQVQAQHQQTAQPKSLPTAAPPQPGQAPFAESIFGQLDKPTGNLLLDTAREYPYQLESGLRSGAEMFGHGTRALGTGKPSGIVGQIAGGAQAIGAPVSALFGPISRPVHDWVGNPAERLTGIPGTADVVTAGALTLPGAFKLPGALRSEPRVNEPAPPRTQVDTLAGGDRARTQREDVLNSMQQAKSAAYKASEDAGIIIKPDPIKAATDAIHTDLAEFGYEPTAQPNIAPILDRLRSVADNETPVTLKWLDTIRKMAVNAAKPSLTHPSQAPAAGIILNHLDNLTSNLNPGDTISTGGATASTDAINSLYRARALAKAQAKADLIDTALSQATNNAKGSSNYHYALALRGQLKNILNRIDSGKIKFFTKDEIANLRIAADHGGYTMPILNALSKLSPDHGLAMLGELGTGFAGGPLGILGAAGAAVVGSGAKMGTEAIANYRANRIFNQLARGTPPKQIKPNSPQALLPRVP